MAGFPKGQDMAGNSRPDAKNSEESPGKDEPGANALPGFHRFLPSPEKRTKLLTQHKQNLDMYDAYKESRRFKYASEKPRKVGGSGVTPSECVFKKQRDVTSSKIKAKLDRDEWQQKQKRAEDAKIQAKLEKCRAQAEKNEMRERRNQEALQQQHRERRLEWLSEVEADRRASSNAPADQSHRTYHQQPSFEFEVEDDLSKLMKLFSIHNRADIIDIYNSTGRDFRETKRLLKFD